MSYLNFHRIWRIVLIAVICCMAGRAKAHEVRPALLQLNEIMPGQFSALWKQPVVDGKRLKITPIFPSDCRVTNPRISRNGNMVAERSRLDCALTEGEITLNGLERTLTDVFIEIKYLNDVSLSGLVKPDNPTMTLGGPKASAAKQYLWIGVEHILYGWDHFLFVIGLTLLVSRRQILGVATTFTIAHSITLVLAVLGGITLPSRPVEILIAASIVLLAIEVLHKLKGRPTLGARKPYLISFLIGLIHGCGFAGALSEIGLPKGTEILALFLFNIGVELGQFTIIALTVIILFALGKISLKYLRRAEFMTTYMFAAIAMFWLIERLAGYAVSPMV